MQTTMVIIFWAFLMFYQFFLSPRVKQSLINTNKLVYSSCLAEQLRILEIRKVQNNVKTSWNYTLVPNLPPKNKILSILAKYSLKIEIELFP